MGGTSEETDHLVNGQSESVPVSEEAADQVAELRDLNRIVSPK